jgi:acetamidase/formamidase
MRRSTLILPLAIASLASGETHVVKPSTYRHTFSAAYPVLERVRPGDTVITTTIDAGGQDQKGARVSAPSNPLTGPFLVEGAEPGDALLVRLRRLRMNRNWGWSTYRLGLFSLAADSIEGLYPRGYKPDLVRPGSDAYVPWDIDLDQGLVRLREPASRRLRLEFAAKPMLGCIGVAAPGEFAPTSGISGPYGGNLDYNQIAEGATVILPVYHPGGLLFVGDGHALQADGEPLGTGIETSMDLEFTVELRKQARLTGPRLETADSLISIGSQPEFASSLDRALQAATSDMARWLARDYDLEPWAAHLLIGLQGRYDVITVAGSVGLRVPRSALPK